MKYFDNFYDMRRTEQVLDGLILRSKRAYERGNHEKERQWAGCLEERIAAIDPAIKVDWPGLYPTFTFKGFEHYTVESLINALSMIEK